MSKVKTQQVNGIAQWQSDRMRMILTQRWQEVWAVVETRVKNNGDLLSVSRELVTPMKANPLE